MITPETADFIVIEFVMCSNCNNLLHAGYPFAFASKLRCYVISRRLLPNFACFVSVTCVSSAGWPAMARILGSANAAVPSNLNAISSNGMVRLHPSEVNDDQEHDAVGRIS